MSGWFTAVERIVHELVPQSGRASLTSRDQHRGGGRACRNRAEAGGSGGSGLARSGLPDIRAGDVAGAVTTARSEKKSALLTAILGYVHDDDMRNS